MVDDRPNTGYRVTVTPLVTHAAPVAERLIVVHFPLSSAPRPARVDLTVGDAHSAHDLGVIPPGETMAHLRVPEVGAPLPGHARLTIGEDTVSLPFALAPARPWTVYVVPHSHTDIGFTHPASEVAAIHNENVDEAIVLCNLTRDWPAGCRFKWTCEVSWQVQNYVRHRPWPQVARLQECLRRGQMEIAAVYAGLHTDICGLEELVRSLALAGGLRREWGVTVDTAMICDVPGVTWAYAQVLAKAGIRYLIVADNNFSAPFLATTDLPRPFYWQGPEGSRVLAWYTDDPFWAYLEGYKLGFGESYRHVLRSLPLKLAELEEQRYPYDAFQLQLASDNCRLAFRPAHIVRQWQEEWANPRLRLATAREFLAHMEANYAAQLPARQGDWTNWWSSTVTSFAHETALGRRLKEDLASAEKLSSWAHVAGLGRYPAALTAAAYDDLLAFDEHSGGGGVWRPRSPEEQARALLEGYAFPHRAAAAAGQALQAAADSLARQVPNEGDQPAVAVLNPLSWDRTDLVEVALPAGSDAAAALDPASGQLLPLQPVAAGVARFLAPGVPSLGYRAFQLVPARAQPTEPLTASSGHLENRFYRVEVDGQGRIRSIVDRVEGRELVAGTWGRFLWYVPRPHREFPPGGEFPDQVELYEGRPVPGELLPPLDRPAQVRVAADGPVSARLIVEREERGPFHLRQEIALHAGLRRIDLAYTLTPQGDARAPEARHGYLHFPFRLDDPRFRLELPGALLSPEEEQLKGACRDHFAAQHWVAAYNSAYTALLTPLDTQLVELGLAAPSHQKFVTRWEPEAATIWARALTLGPAHALTDSPYSQGAPLTLRFSLATHAGPLDPVAAMHHGWAAFSPLLAGALPPGQAGTLPAGHTSWCELWPASVTLVTAKPATDGDGLILRLWEASGQACTATLALPHLGRFRAWLSDLLEEEIAPLEVAGGVVHIPMAGLGLETVRLRWQE